MTFNKLAAKIAKRDGIHQNRKEIKKGSEIATDVHLHHIAGHGVVLAFFLDVFFKPPDAIVCASFLDATEAVVNKCALKDLMRVIVIEMMYDAVAEFGSEHLRETNAFFHIALKSHVPFLVLKYLSIVT